MSADARPDAFSLIDYVIVHERCHVRVKNHSKAFWAELSRHLPACRTLDARMGNGGGEG